MHLTFFIQPSFPPSHFFFCFPFNASIFPQPRKPRASPCLALWQQLPPYLASDPIRPQRATANQCVSKGREKQHARSQYTASGARRIEIQPHKKGGGGGCRQCHCQPPPFPQPPNISSEGHIQLCCSGSPQKSSSLFRMMLYAKCRIPMGFPFKNQDFSTPCLIQC